MANQLISRQGLLRIAGCGFALALACLYGQPASAAVMQSGTFADDGSNEAAPDTFNVTNDVSSTENILTVVIDLTTAADAGTVFDIAGGGSFPFSATLAEQTEVGFQSAVVSGSLKTLTLTFNDFQANETFTFTIDLDDSNPGGQIVQGTSIARMSVHGDGTFGAPEVLRASADGSQDTLFFPSYSPDSKWIAFVRATGKSKDNVTSVISLLPAGGGDPIALTRMNERVRDQDGVTGIEVRVTDVYGARDVARRIESALGGFPHRARDWMETNRNLFSALKLEKVVYGIVLCLIVVVAAFNILATLTMVVKEKRRDIAILKTMGGSSASIGRIFVLNGAVIGVVGTLLGNVLGVAGCWVLAHYQFVELPKDVFLVTTLPVRMDPLNFGIVATVSVAICVIAALSPARRAASLVPVEVIRYE